jgi:small GTP-binding protein
VKFRIRKFKQNMNKVVFIGNGGVGKSAIINKHMNGEFIREYTPTLGMEIHHIGNMIIYDYAGQEKYNTVNTGLFTADAIVIFYDTGSILTGKHLSFWKSMVPLNTPYLIVGTKSDIVPHKFNCPEADIEISSKNGDGIDDLFTMIREMVE